MRGTIERVEDDVYVVKARDGSILKLIIAANTGVAPSVRSNLSDIKPVSYIGVAALPLPDGSQRALEVHIFHESMRGTGEGHRSWDLQPNSTMTNAHGRVDRGNNGRPFVEFEVQGWGKRIIVPTGTVIVTYLPGSVAELRPGAAIFVPAAVRHPNGTLEAPRVMVGRDAAPPQ